MEAQMIEAIDFNWSADGNGGANWETHRLGQNGVTGIFDATVVGEGVVCYRIEFGNGRAEIVFNPNRVFIKPLVD
jgi:hypothetical protein